jgi:hypothetical protein
MEPPQHWKKRAKAKEEKKREKKTMMKMMIYESFVLQSPRDTDENGGLVNTALIATQTSYLKRYSDPFE